MSEVMVLGGAGLQGAAAARVLSALPGVERVVIADRDGAAAQAVAAGIGEKAVSDEIDARDASVVLGLLRKWSPSLVLNCVGPFRSVGAATLRAAIEAGVDYVDLLDDADVVSSYMALDDMARSSGVTAVFGSGFTPGLTNIMGRYLADELDSVEEIHWTYIVNATPSVPVHLMTHRVQMFARDAMVVRDGSLISVPGGSEPLPIPWTGVGTFPGTLCTHPEPICAHRYYPGIKHATIRGCYTAPDFLFLLGALGTSGWGEESPFVSGGAELRPDRVIGDFLSSDVFRESVVWARVLEAEEKYGDLDGVRVAVGGKRDGVTVRRVAQQVTRGNRWQTTHTTAAVAAGIIATGRLQAPGVHSAEVFDPSSTLAALADAGVTVDVFDGDDAPEFTTS